MYGTDISATRVSLGSAFTNMGKSETPLSRTKVDAVVEKSEGSYNRHIPLPYDVRDVTSEVHGNGPLYTPDGRPQVILGAYRPTGRRPRAQTSAAAQGGTIGAPPHVHGRTLVSAQNVARRERLCSTLGHEVLGYFGLSTLQLEIKSQILDVIRSNPLWNLEGDYERQS